MFDHYQKSLVEKMKFQAGIHGIDLSAELDSSSSSKPTKNKKITSKKNEGIFQSQEHYGRMTEEEKEQETNKMLGFLKGWSNKVMDIGA